MHLSVGMKMLFYRSEINPHVFNDLWVFYEGHKITVRFPLTRLLLLNVLVQYEVLNLYICLRLAI